MTKGFFDRIPYGEPANFTKYSLEHIVALIICIILIYLFIRITPNIKKSRYEKYIRYSLAAFMLLSNITIYLYVYISNLPWYMYLPEATCGWAIYFGGIGLLTKNRALLILTFYYGYGAIFTLLGPSVLEGINKYNFYQFFLRHVLILIAGLYMIKVLDFKLNKRDFKLYFIVTFIMVIIGGLISIIVNDPNKLNMFYTLRPGINGTPLSWLYGISYPLYLVAWILFATLIGYLYGLPFYAKVNR